MIVVAVVLTMTACGGDAKSPTTPDHNDSKIHTRRCVSRWHDRRVMTIPNRNVTASSVNSKKSSRSGPISICPNKTVTCLFEIGSDLFHPLKDPHTDLQRENRRPLLAYHATNTSARSWRVDLPTTERVVTRPPSRFARSRNRPVSPICHGYSQTLNCMLRR